MFATQVISEVNRLGASITVDAAGENLIIEPGSLLTPELIGELRKHKPFILLTLARREERRRNTSPPIENVGAVLEMARARFGPVEDPITLPPLPGRDPLVKRGTDKGRFFRGDWRSVPPIDWTPYRPGGAA